VCDKPRALEGNIITTLPASLNACWPRKAGTAFARRGLYPRHIARAETLSADTRYFVINTYPRHTASTETNFCRDFAKR